MYKSDIPKLLNDFLIYLISVKGYSQKTVVGYYLDLKLFIKYMYMTIILKKETYTQEDISNLIITNIDDNFFKNINLTNIYEFIYFLNNQKNNSAKTRARKSSSIKSFFKYISINRSIIEKNPAEHLSLPSIKKSLPKHLSLEQTNTLIQNINTKFIHRDRCIIMIFLNCALRISELISIDINDIVDDKLKVLGKGNKERIIYLNKVTLNSISEYLKERKKILKIYDKSALFIGKLGKRLSVRRVQFIVKECLHTAGLSNMGFSPHKLRHTSATLMYEHGDVDINVLKEILGHQNLGTTEIYTHVSNKKIKKAIDNHPLNKNN